MATKYQIRAYRPQLGTRTGRIDYVVASFDDEEKAEEYLLKRSWDTPNRKHYKQIFKIEV